MNRKLWFWLSQELDRKHRSIKMGSLPGSTKKHITFANRMKVHEFLKPLIVAHEDGTCSYPPGWGDEVVAQRMGFTKANIAFVRKHAFGKLRGDTPTPKKPKRANQGFGTYQKVIDRLDEQDKRLEGLSETLAEISVIIKKLM